ncbi:replication initiator protein A [Staphylococcus pettenkoferi]|uniref:replication initiator protein A n=1 Tax=Staphylococcus pettenkoferi TaxID=170573 RepID=UPI002557466C|nr:replication initiator protein A [Staphylococcus pettenkoferi]MDK7284315.1 replication initiator protein A [Staphylococcus pettenkoferi]
MVFQQPNTRYYVLDKNLFKTDTYKHISNTAKLGYAILQDYLSIAVDKDWIDKEGRLYIEVTNEELGKILNKSNNTIVKIKKELEKVELLHQKRTGSNKPNRLYLSQPKPSKNND